MDVVTERNRCVTQFVDALQGLEPSGKTDLHNVVAEGTSIRDDVDIACTDIGSPVIVLRDRTVDCGNLGFELRVVRSARP